jgi:NhaP-type Na+/H+ or K+/H+ antiporter
MPDVHVSGILAIVSLGLYMTKKGKLSISSESEIAVHQVWQSIGFLAETLIFLGCGVMIGYNNAQIVTWENFGKGIVLFFFLNLIRFMLLLMLLPIMRRLGYPMDIRHCVLMTWGGLRGALALFLSLQIFNNQKISKEAREIILFQSSLIAIITLVFNGPTTGLLVQTL